MKNFQYDDKYASDYQLVICSFDSSSGANTIDMGSQFENNKIKISGTDEFLAVNNDYSSPLSFVFQACKMQDCTPCEITPQEYSLINRWLNRKESHKFKIDKNGYQDIFFMGSFNIKAIKVNDIIYGIEFTFTSDYPYGFLDEIDQDYSGKQFMVYNHSDEVGDIYPYIIITCLEAGNLEVENSMDNEILEINNCVANEVITMDGLNKVITSSISSHKLYNDFNFNYLKLINTYTERKNIFTSSLNINMEVKYSPVRKVGI